jgi:hypothetical protein
VLVVYSCSLKYNLYMCVDGFWDLSCGMNFQQSWLKVIFFKFTFWDYFTSIDLAGILKYTLIYTLPWDTNFNVLAHCLNKFFCYLVCFELRASYFMTTWIIPPRLIVLAVFERVSCFYPMLAWDLSTRDFCLQNSGNYRLKPPVLSLFYQFYLVFPLLLFFISLILFVLSCFL